MIFVTVGTHPGQFNRLVKRIDEIAPQIKEKIIVQRGFTKYVPKNVESFEFAPDLSPYFNKARIVISHSATSLIEFIMSHNKPIITVPRQKKYGEHINDHQVEFADFLAKKAGVLCIKDITRLDAKLLASYKNKVYFDAVPLKRFRNRLKDFLRSQEI